MLMTSRAAAQAYVRDYNRDMRLHNKDVPPEKYLKVARWTLRMRIDDWR